jgi:pimeloyl-ACP methyl ester carboxylesterase
VPRLPTNGIELGYEIHGDGDETLVLVAGLVDPKEAWANQVPAFAERFRVVVLDNRGTGESSAPPGPYTTGTMAEDLAGLVDALGLGRFHLLGLSLGGMVAQEYAIAHPERLCSAAFCHTYAHAGPYGLRTLASFRQAAEAAGTGLAQRQALLWAFTPEFFLDRPDEAAQVDEIIAANPAPLETYLAHLDAAEQHDARGRLGGVGCPALTLVGERDLLIPPRLSRALHDELPQSSWVEISGPHAAFWERPEELNRAVLSFLCGVGAA